MLYLSMPPQGNVSFKAHGVLDSVQPPYCLGVTCQLAWFCIIAWLTVPVSKSLSSGG